MAHLLLGLGLSEPVEAGTRSGEGGLSEMGIVLVLALMAVLVIATALLPAALEVVMGALPYAAVAFIATANVGVLPLAGVFALVLLLVGGKVFVVWIRRSTGPVRDHFQSKGLRGGRA